MEEHLHPTTVTAAMRILVILLSNQSILAKFKEGLSGGGWLDQTDSVLTNKIGTVLGMCDILCNVLLMHLEWCSFAFLNCLISISFDVQFCSEDVKGRVPVTV